MESNKGTMCGKIAYEVGARPLGEKLKIGGRTSCLRF